VVFMYVFEKVSNEDKSKIICNLAILFCYYK